MVEAVVEFDYKAQEPDELTLKKGDVISEIRMRPGGWWEGILARTGKRGMFPDNFVRVIDLANSQADVPHRKSSGRRCKVLYTYEPANDDELELKIDDIIEVLGEVEEGWWKGKLKSKTGVFPSNFVVEINDDPKESSRRKSSTSSLDEPTKLVNAMNHDDSSAKSDFDSDVPVLPPKPVKEMCRAIYPYEAVNDDELSLQKGDVITLLSRDGQDIGWWKGELRGKIGVFPDNFVQVIPSEELTKPSRPPVKVNNITTNRVRDSITKPTPTSASPPAPQAHRKSIELPPKPDEKLSPPGVSKKPVLPPPPLKKPIGSRSPSSSTVNKTSYPTESKQNATTPTKQPESPTTSGPGLRLPITNLTASLKQSSSSSDVPSSQPDLSKSSVTTGPKRSESTDLTDGSFFSRSSTSYSVSNHTNHTSTETTEQIRSTGDVDLDCVGRTAMLTHPTASRVRAPRRRPPSVINTKESPESGGLVNGNIEPHIDNEKSNRASFVQELKMSQAKKNSSIVGTRVMISSSNSSNSISSTESSTVVESTKISPGITLRNLPVNMPRPHSMLGGGMNISPRGFQLPPSSPDSVTISAKQFSELMEKISRLESQHEVYQQAIKDLNNKLNEEVERRLQMQLELEKLTDLVTQV